MEVSNVLFYYIVEGCVGSILVLGNLVLLSYKLSISNEFLGEKYVFVPADKAANNVVIVFRFISASSKCSTTTLSKKLTTALSTTKDFIINYCNKCCEHNGVNYFWSVKNSFEVLDKLYNIQDSFASVDSYDFSTLYTTLPHHLIKDKLSYLIKWSFDKCGSQFICCNSFHAFFCDNKHDKYTNWTYEDLTNALKFLLDNIYVRFGNIVYKQVIGIPMGTNCAPLIADLFLYWYESQFMAKIYKNPTEHDLVDKFNNTYRCLDDILALNNTDFGNYIKE